MQASRQGTSSKRANGDFPCPAWKIVIGHFNHLAEFAKFAKFAELGEFGLVV